VRILGLPEKTRIYQASTSVLYGLVQEIPQKESYGMVACNGVLFNHESPRRGETFVTCKITRGLARVDAGLNDCPNMSNLDLLRGWGHARETSSAGGSTRCVPFCAVCTELEIRRWTDLACLRRRALQPE